jgi:SAM-dependent methyltransferase
VAPDGGRVVGVDLLAESVEAARRNAEGLPNVELRQADLLDFLAEQADETFSGALFFEVAYEVLDLPRTVRELHRVLRLGAPLLASFRTQQYLALFAVRGRDWELADAVVRKRSGHLPAMGWQSWHTSAEAAALLQEAGFAEVELGGIGICSGIAGDPLAAIAGTPSSWRRSWSVSRSSRSSLHGRIRIPVGTC